APETRLAATGEPDDPRSARRYAEDKRALRGWGAERIRAALAHRGLDPELIDRAIREPDGAGELERAIALLRRRGEGLESEAGRRRALDYLVRRGYAYEVAYAAVRALDRAA